MKTLSHLLLILLLPTCALAQDYKRTWNWYIDDSIGISFNTVPPTITLGGVSNTEGTASISDTNGNLLFYTNGVTVWNKNHQVMQNGTGLNGHISSTQSALIVPQPDNDSLFYVFTTDAVGQAKGLQYSIVNINANGGLGAVTVKNILLQTPVCEKLAATKHQNGRDVWILAHGFGNNTFYCYLVTKSGLKNCPIISNIGTIHDNSLVSKAQGQMKFSVDGKRVAATLYSNPDGKIDLFNFNNITGQLSNHIAIANIQLPFGLEFSANGKHIYTTTRTNELIAYDVSMENINDIENSKTMLADYPNLHWTLIGLQLNIDSKINVFYRDSLFVGAINYPDSGGAKCQYNLFDFSTGVKRTRGGVPNYISSYLNNLILDFTYFASCNIKQVHFNAQTANNQNNFQWRIKRLADNTASLSNIKSFTYTFPDSGLYEVRLIANNDTITKTIFIDATILPQTDTLGCGTDSVVLTVPSSYRCLQWSDTSSQSYSRIIKTSGTYSIQGYNSHGCLITDSISINFSASPVQPVIAKINDSLQSTPSYTYQWLLNDTAIAGATAQKLKPVKAGIYKVIITDSNGCSNVSNAFSSNVGVHEFLNRPISIYPNPARSEIIFESAEEFDINITTITGQSILLEKFKSGRNILNVSSFSKGIYFIQINTNSKTYNQKIIIQ